MAKMRAMVVPKAGGSSRRWSARSRAARREMRIRVQACGVCHSDSVTVEGHIPGITYPRDSRP